MTTPEKPTRPSSAQPVPTGNAVLGLVLILIGVGAQIALVKLTGERSLWDFVALIPVAAGAHVISRRFTRDLLEGIKARFGGGRS